MALPEGSLALVLGTGLALGALTLVLSPLLSAIDTPPETPPQSDANKASARKAKRAGEQSNMAVDALREIEFDRETGKLSDSDYADLKQRYTREALAEMRAADGNKTAATSVVVTDVNDPALDPVEAAIARAASNVKNCGGCGPRPEPDATYCSSCGRFLPGSCGSCGTSIDLVGSRFCSGCGTQLAAA